MISATQLLKRICLLEGATEFKGYVAGPLAIPWSAASRLAHTQGESQFHADPIDYMNPNLFRLSWQQQLVRWWDRGYFDDDHEVMLLPVQNENIINLYVFKKAQCTKDGTLPLPEDKE